MGKGQSFQQMVLGILDIHMQKYEVGTLFYTMLKQTNKQQQQKTLKKWIKDLNVRVKTINF